MEKTYRWIYDEMTSGRTSVVNAVPNAVTAAHLIQVIRAVDR
jgi:hypothetical protein